METVFEVIQSVQLSFSQMIVVSVLIFSAGWFVGTIKARRLSRINQRLENTVMELNEELLYGTSANSCEPSMESTTPVIGLKPKHYKNPQIAK